MLRGTEARCPRPQPWHSRVEVTNRCPVSGGGTRCFSCDGTQRSSARGSEVGMYHTSARHVLLLAPRWHPAHGTVRRKPCNHCDRAHEVGLAEVQERSQQELSADAPPQQRRRRVESRHNQARQARTACGHCAWSPEVGKGRPASSLVGHQRETEAVQCFIGDISEAAGWL